MSGDDTGTLRILLVAASNRRRGAEVFTEQLVSGLSREHQDWDLDAVSLTRVNSGATVSLPPLTDVGPHSAGRFNPTILRALRGHIRRRPPDVVVAMGGSTLRYAVAANVRPMCNLVYFAIGEPTYWLRGVASRLVNRALLGRVDRVVAVSDMTASQLIGLKPALDGRVSTVYTGVDDSLFALEPRGTGDDRRLRVVFIGSLSSEKDPLLAIEAASRVEDCILRFVGDGPQRLESELAASEVGEDRFEFVGSVDDVSPHLEWADLVLLTSRTEGLPGVILEAAAAGVPSIGVDVGGVDEAIEHGVTGLVVDRDPADIAAALETLLEDRGRLDEMGRSARERARHLFRLDDSISRFGQVLEEMIP